MTKASEAYINHIDMDVFCDGCPYTGRCPVMQDPTKYWPFKGELMKYGCYKHALVKEILALLEEADSLWQ